MKKNFLSVQDLSQTDIIELLKMAHQFRQNDYKIHKQLFTANLFFEPSTRTKMSFMVAERKLGLEPLEFHAEMSSMKKGETLYDTAKTFEAIGANLLVIRHAHDDWTKELGGNISIPIVNACAGKKSNHT